MIETDIDTCCELDSDHFLFEQLGPSRFCGKGDAAPVDLQIALATNLSSVKGSVALTWSWIPVALCLFYAFLLSVAQF